MRGRQLRQHVHRLERVPRADEREGVDGLVAQLGALDVRAGRVGEEAEFGREGGGEDVDTLEEEARARFGGDEVGGQAAGGGRVDEFGALGEEEAAEGLGAQADFFGGRGEGFGLEVAAVEDLVVGRRRRRMGVGGGEDAATAMRGLSVAEFNSVVICVCARRRSSTQGPIHCAAVRME